MSDRWAFRVLPVHTATGSTSVLAVTAKETYTEDLTLVAISPTGPQVPIGGFQAEGSDSNTVAVCNGGTGDSIRSRIVTYEYSPAILPPGADPFSQFEEFEEVVVRIRAVETNAPIKAELRVPRISVYDNIQMSAVADCDEDGIEDLVILPTSGNGGQLLSGGNLSLIRKIDIATRVGYFVTRLDGVGQEGGGDILFAERADTNYVVLSPSTGAVVMTGRFAVSDMQAIRVLAVGRRVGGAAGDGVAWIALGGEKGIRTGGVIVLYDALNNKVLFTTPFIPDLNLADDQIASGLLPGDSGHSWAAFVARDGTQSRNRRLFVLSPEIPDSLTELVFGANRLQIPGNLCAVSGGAGTASLLAITTSWEPQSPGVVRRGPIDFLDISKALDLD
jgi:hypothetical protein